MHFFTTLKKTFKLEELIEKDNLWKLLYCIFGLVIKEWPYRMQSDNKSINGTLQNSGILRNTYRSALGMMFQYYFTVSENFFPPLCLHALLITCISCSFFHFLPVFSSFFRKKLEEISNFFHSSWKKPNSSGSFQTLLKLKLVIKSLCGSQFMYMLASM